MRPSVADALLSTKGSSELPRMESLNPGRVFSFNSAVVNMFKSPHKINRSVSGLLVSVISVRKAWQIFIWCFLSAVSPIGESKCALAMRICS